MKNENLLSVIAIIIVIAIVGGIVWGLCTFGEPSTSIDVYKFQDNKIDRAYIHLHNDYVYSIGHPRKIFNANDSTRFLLEIDEEYANITAKYSTTTEPIWTELGELVDFVDMGNNKYLIDCKRNLTDTPITYCIEGTKSSGDIVEFYFSYVIN